MTHRPFDAPLSAYREQAEQLGKPPDEALLAVARFHDFLDWTSLETWVLAVEARHPEVYPFECAVEAVIHGDAAKLRRMLADRPGLVHERSSRVAHFDPPRNEATLLHYIAANGVEGYRQKTPPNALEIAEILLDGGADPNALAFAYGGRCSVLSLLVSSCHPAEAGLQTRLANLLIDRGVSLEPSGEGAWTSPLLTAIVFGYRETAELLAARGAPVERLAEAAGLGQVDQVTARLPGATPSGRHEALATAAQLGRTEVVRLLLEAGEDPDRYHPNGFHAHSTALHQAALAGWLDTVKLLVERGARLDIRDRIWNATPLGWARHAGRAEAVAYLISRGAPE